MRILLSQSAACPSSSKAITTTAAPCFFTMVACRRNSSSPTCRDQRQAPAVSALIHRPECCDATRPSHSPARLRPKQISRDRRVHSKEAARCVAGKVTPRRLDEAQLQKSDKERLPENDSQVRAASPNTTDVLMHRKVPSEYSHLHYATPDSALIHDTRHQSTVK